MDTENYIIHLQAILEQSDLTQQKLAQRLGVTHAALNRWLRRRAIPHPRHRLAIAQLYKSLIGFRPLTPAQKSYLMKKARSFRRAGLWEQIDRKTVLQDELLLEHTYHSNAIEGSTLSKRQTEAIIFDHSHLPDKTLVEHLEATNHATVLREIFQRKYPSQITESLILRLHHALLQGIRHDAGEYSKHQRVIRGVSLALTHPKDIRDEIQHLLNRWRRSIRQGVTLSDIVQFHADFELIHPFGDGNGRVGRLLMLMQLLSQNFPPVVIEQNRKADYYEVLEHAQRQSADPFLVFLVDEMEQTSRLLRKHHV